MTKHFTARKVLTSVGIFLIVLPEPITTVMGICILLSLGISTKKIAILRHGR